jgi:hypothetical protein
MVRDDAALGRLRVILNWHADARVRGQVLHFNISTISMVPVEMLKCKT